MRFVVFRVDDATAPSPTMFTPAGERLLVREYAGPPNCFGTSFQDALGGSYRVLRIAAPAGAKSANLRVNPATGQLAASASRAYRDVARVKVLTRELCSVLLADLPMSPDPKAVYVPRHFLPDGVISANHGLAHLPDGSTLELKKSERGVTFEMISIEVPMFADDDFASLRRETFGPKRRLVKLWTVESPGGVASDHVLFDEEGWPVIVRSPQRYPATVKQNEFFYNLYWPNQRVDLITVVPSGAYRTLWRGERGSAEGKSWRYDPRGLGNGSLSLAVPSDVSVRVANMDYDIVPLDARGKPVSGPGDNRIGELFPANVEVGVFPENLARVAAVEIRARPYAWVRFPNVDLTQPAGGSGFGFPPGEDD